MLVVPSDLELHKTLRKAKFLQRSQLKWPLYSFVCLREVKTKPVHLGTDCFGLVHNFVCRGDVLCPVVLLYKLCLCDRDAFERIDLRLSQYALRIIFAITLRSFIDVNFSLYQQGLFI